MSSERRFNPMILHPTDLSSDGESAFAHAMKLALMQKSGIYILHVDRPGREHTRWEEFPAVRELLVRWGLLPSGTPRDEVLDRLGIVVEKVLLEGRSVSGGIAAFREHHRFAFEMMVVATAGREGLPRWLHPSVAEHIAREVHIPTLFVPGDAMAFVDLVRGEVLLDQVLVPIDHSPSPQVSILAVADLARDLQLSDCEVTVIHAGQESDFPAVELVDDEYCRYRRTAESGEPVEVILEKADEMQAKLIVMSTKGHDGFLDVLRGSVTEQVLRSAPCPVLTVPTDPRSGFAYTL